MIDNAASPLVLTKLHAPAARPRIVPRKRLIERLTLESGTGLILVVSPPGYGKTTLLGEWSQALTENGVAVAWYSLDPSDDAPFPFSSYFVASLAQALGSTTGLAHTAQLLRSSPEIDLQRILPAVINAVASNDRECVLILDDYHLIGSPVIHSAVAYLLEHLPRNLHIAIGSRSDPPLPLARLRVRGHLLEIRTRDLRFTEDETAQFLNAVMRLELGPELISELEERTEGWVAGLQLAALSLEGRTDKKGFISTFAGGNRPLVNYLLEEVVSHQTEEVQSFLLYTSILERLSGSLCDAILNRSSSGEAMLEHLDQTNLFVVALDDDGYWYRYHHLFREFLQERLYKYQPELVIELHRRASEWYASHDFWREAVRHALQTQDWDYAAALVEQQGVSMMLHSEFSTVHEWCAAFPDEVMRVHPSLCLFQANALVLGYRRQNRSKIEKRLQQVEEAAATLEGKQLARLLIGQAAATRTALAALVPDPAVDPREQFTLAERALEWLSEDDPARSAIALTVGYAQMALQEADGASKTMEKARQLSLDCHNYFGVVEAIFQQACLAHKQGQLRRAAEICRQGQADISLLLAHPDQELPSVGCLDIELGCISLEQNRLEEAERDLLHGLDLIGWGMNTYYQMTACLALFRLRDYQGRPVEAIEFLARLEETWPDIAFCTQATRIMQALRTGPEDAVMMAEAINWCRDFSSSLGDNEHLPGMGPFGAAEAYYLAHLAQARIQIASGNAQAALSYLERQLSLATTNGLKERVIELSLLEAQAWQAEGDQKRTREALARALSTGEAEGYLRIFDQGPALTRLLVEAAERGISREYIRQILAAIGAPTPPEKVQGLVSEEHISQREREVLRLMEEGASNQAIAEQLVISIGTVKSHINHILRKLDASNRTEAVARARQLGLLEA